MLQAEKYLSALIIASNKYIYLGKLGMRQSTYYTFWTDASRYIVCTSQNLFYLWSLY